MKSRFFITNVILIALIAFLVSLISFWPSEQKKGLFKIIEIDEGQIEEIKINRRGKDEILMSRESGIWRLKEPSLGRIDEFQLERILEIVSAESSHRVDEYNRNNLGLTQPELIVQFNGNDLVFGDINPVTNEQYVESQEFAFLIPTHFGYSVPGDHKKLLSRKLLGDEEVPVGMDFGDWTVVRGRNGSWEIEGKGDLVRAKLSSDDLNYWITGWQLSSSLESRQYLGQPKGRLVNIFIENGITISFRVAKNNLGYLFSRLDENISYQLGEDAGKRLLDPLEVITQNQ